MFVFAEERIRQHHLVSESTWSMSYKQMTSPTLPITWNTCRRVPISKEWVFQKMEGTSRPAHLISDTSLCSIHAMSRLMRSFDEREGERTVGGSVLQTNSYPWSSWYYRRFLILWNLLFSLECLWFSFANDPKIKRIYKSTVSPGWVA